jgi:hypothetical protein
VQHCALEQLLLTTCAFFVLSAILSILFPAGTTAALLAAAGPAGWLKLPLHPNADTSHADTSHSYSVFLVPSIYAAPPAALLAAAGPSGWLKLYQASLPGPHSWQLLHSSSPGALAGPITAVAFSPDGDTLAVAGPAAQVLGTDATAVAAAGGQPGAVSLYCIGSSSSGTAGGTAGGAAGQQQQQKRMQLWHQWCLRSLPVSVAVLAGRGVQLMTGRRLGAMQVRAAAVVWLATLLSLFLRS